MLRVLGYRSKGLIQILSIRTLIFAIPGLIIGMYVMTLLLNAIKITVFYFTQFATYIAVDNFTIIMVTFIIIMRLEHFNGIIGTFTSNHCSYQ